MNTTTQLPTLAIESLPMEQPALLEVPAVLPPATAWSGGTHDGSRLTQEEKLQIRTLWATEHLSSAEIARRLGHSRNTVKAVISDPAYEDELLKTRKMRFLVEEEDMLRVRGEVVEKKHAAGKLNLGDVNSALMIGSMIIKDSGGAVPQRIEIAVEHGFDAAAALMTGLVQGQGPQPAQRQTPFAPPPPVVDVDEVETDANDKDQATPRGRAANTQDSE